MYVCGRLGKQTSHIPKAAGDVPLSPLIFSSDILSVRYIIDFGTNLAFRGIREKF